MSKNFRLPLLVCGFLVIFSVGFLAGKFDKKENVLSESSTNSPKPSISPSPSVIPNPSLGQLYPVLKVVDGDTIDVSVDGKSKAVRLIGIDTPEVVDPRKSVECFGEQASEESKKILIGKSVYLESDPTQGDLDKYRRLLRYVFLEDGTNFNLMMIAQGYAHEYTYNLPYKYQAQFKTAEHDAMTKNLGLWSSNTCGGNTGTSSTSINETIQTSNSTTQIIQQTSTSQGQTVSGSSYKPTGTYTCDCSKLCSKIKTCDEAYYQLQNCGCSARDSDGDGVPCESLCNN